jgi:predicted acyltransferase
MAGLAIVFLAIFYWLIDVLCISRWAKPFIVLGLNPITVYVISELFDTALRSLDLVLSKGNRISCQLYLFQELCIPYAEAKTASLLYAVWILTCMLLVAWIMWRKRLFIKV